MWELGVKCKELAASAGAAVETKAEASRERHSQRVTTTWRGWWDTAPAKVSDRAYELMDALSAVDWHHNLTTESPVTNPAEGTPNFPPTIIPTLLPWLTSPWITLAQLCGGPAVNPNREQFQLEKHPRNKCMYLFNSQHDLSKYCSGITEGWNGTAWWEKEYLMPVLLTNILDCKIMALGSFFKCSKH